MNPSHPVPQAADPHSPGVAIDATLARAFSLAHAGDIDGAQGLLAGVRRDCRIELSPPVAAQVMMIEGVCAAYASDLPRALERFRRAAAITRLTGQADAFHLAQGWLAFARFNAGDVRGAAEAIAGLDYGQEGLQPESRLRSAIVVTILCEYCNLPAMAADWSRFSQVEAARCQRPAPMSAVIFNMAALRLSTRLMGRLHPAYRSAQPQQELMLVKSSINYDRVAGVCTQRSLHHLMEAQALSLLGRHREALKSLEAFAADARHISDVDQAKGAVESLWNRHHAGLPLTLADADAAEARTSQLVHDDDLAVAHHTLAVVYAGLGEPARAAGHRGVAEEHAHRFDEVNQAVRRVLQDMPFRLPAKTWAPASAAVKVLP